MWYIVMLCVSLYVSRGKLGEHVVYSNALCKLYVSRGKLGEHVVYSNALCKLYVSRGKLGRTCGI